MQVEGYNGHHPMMQHPHPFGAVDTVHEPQNLRVCPSLDRGLRLARSSA
jgi:hypothetical protein